MSRKRARAMGINHIALEVADIDAALEFYGQLVDFEISSRSKTAAFIYFGDQFINFSLGREQTPDQRRHFGLVVDDKDAVRDCLTELGVAVLPGRFLDFLDPWGNRVEIVSYQNIRFTKTSNILAGMEMPDPGKTDKAQAELEAAGMGPNNGPKSA